MGGGEDSRIPSVLNQHINDYVNADEAHIDIVVRTYDIDPYVAGRQIAVWREELNPHLVIGESLGSIHAIMQKGVPHLFVSPAVGASRWMALASYIPGASWLMRKMFRPRPGNRQSLDFTYDVLSHYRGIRNKVLECSPSRGGTDYFFAFFGTEDTYRRWGVVSVRSWARHFGRDSYMIYKGTHYMEEEFLYSMLIPKILSVLGISAAAEHRYFTLPGYAARPRSRTSSAFSSSGTSRT